MYHSGDSSGNLDWKPNVKFLNAVISGWAGTQYLSIKTCQYNNMMTLLQLASQFPAHTNMENLKYYKQTLNLKNYKLFSHVSVGFQWPSC